MDQSLVTPALKHSNVLNHKYFFFQYTCFCVSRNFLIFGATSGGLYVFRREPCIFLQLLPNKVFFFTFSLESIILCFCFHGFCIS
jgi:hypothetical protein